MCVSVFTYSNNQMQVNMSFYEYPVLHSKAWKGVAIEFEI